jgi:hypothetical protein
MVQVSTNGNDFQGNGLMLQIRGEVKVTMLEPSRGPASAGQTITVKGSGLEGLNDVSCRFGLKGGSVNASNLPGGSLECKVRPTTFSGVVFVDILQGNFSLTPGGIAYEYIAERALLQIIPSQGSRSGGTKVSIAGGDFRTDYVSVRFGQESLLGRVVNRSLVVLVSPPRPAGEPRVRVVIGEDGTSMRQEIVFEYVNTAQTVSLRPSAGTVAGGTTVLVTGSNLAQTAVCAFGKSTGVKANYMSSTLVGCVAPKSVSAGTVDVVVSNHPGEIGGKVIEFEYMPSLVIARIEPTTGLSVGGTVVELVGSVAIASTRWCKFGQSVFKAKAIMGSMVVCESPAHAAGNVTISLSPNGVDFTAAPGYFQYTSGVVISSLVPSVGSEEGGSTLTVRGEGFGVLQKFSCLFGGKKSMKGTVTSASTLKCTTPVSEPGIYRFQVLYGAHLVTSSFGSFEFAPSGQVTALYPTAGSTQGGTVVSVTGIKLQNGTLARFGGREASKPCDCVSTTLLLCTAPPASSAGVSFVTWRINGAAFESALNFLYVDPISVVSVWPAFGETMGRVQITVVGKNFASWQKLRCRIGGKSFRGRYLSESTFQCDAEDLPSGQNVFSISMNGGEYVGTVKFEGLPPASLHGAQCTPRLDRSREGPC